MYEVTTKIYNCDYCTKYYKRKHAAINHEYRCRNNPINKHKCLKCVNLNKVIKISDNDVEYITFHCDITKTEMYSYKAEYMNLDICDTAIRMPLECENFKKMTMFEESELYEKI